MPVTPFFLHGSPSEQRLVQDLVNEHLKMFGQDVLYLPRKIIDENTVIKEIAASRFDDSFRIEAYLSNFDGFGTPSDILTKFGVRSQDEVTLVISKERYDDFISPFLELYSADATVKVTNRPQEGDLIYLPLDNTLFEIKYVEGKVPFYQLNDLFMYELRCEIFEASTAEVIDISDVETGMTGEEITEPLTGGAVAMILTMVSAAATSATATVSYASTTPGVMGLHYVDLINDGNYEATPSVTISKPVKGNAASADATVVAGEVTALTLTNAGTNFLSTPSVTFTPPNRVVASQIKFGNNSLYHDTTTKTQEALWNFASNIDARNGRVVISFWFYPTDLNPSANGGAIIWSDHIKIYHLPDGKIRFASAQTTQGSSEALNLNAWNFIRIVQVGTDARISVNGVSGGPYSNVDPIPFASGDTVYIGADAAGAGRYPTVTSSYLGYVDHFTVNFTTDTQFRTTVETQIPGTITEQEVDLQTSETAGFIQNCDNEYPTVTATIDTNRQVTGFTIVDGGQGYDTVPNVIISEPQQGTQATAVAIMTSRGTIPGQGIDRIVMIDPGVGYDAPPTVTITGGGGGGAIATAVIAENGFGPVAISSGGVGYSTVPNIYVDRIFIPTSSGTTTAINNVQAEAVLDTTGTVVQVRLANAGAAYTFTPTVTFDPVEDPSFGDYSVNEVIQGLESGTKGYVRSWNLPNRRLELYSVDGKFRQGESVVGIGASYTISNISYNEESGFPDNETIELEADGILDFSERNPFGEF
tara:strand:- start:2200 stop:4476 length:2277 start_codon:yes stop_codon:yes gene_type:complete